MIAKNQSEQDAIDWYNENIAITEKIDQALLKRSRKWSRLNKNARFKIIHKTLGVDVIIALYKRFRD